MFVQATASIPAPPSQNSKPEINRRSAGFHPSIWGAHFLSYASNNIMESEEEKREHLKLKEELKEKLMAVVDAPLKKLGLIDAIQRLGVSYHFHKEIDEILGQIMQVMNQSDFKASSSQDDDLYTISLTFRLLRQHGYRISCEMFKKFKDKGGNFKESLIDDVKGMLSLYEATHLRVHGEDILDQALSFTSTHLGSMATSLSNPSLSAQVTNALHQPVHTGMPRLEARRFIPVYQADPSHDKTLLSFARLDFNLLQRLHQKEINDIAKWWKDLDFSTKLPFARDRLIECYFWILGLYSEPEYLLARRFSTKVIKFASVIDDIYDVYGTLDELELLTEAIQRWDINAIDQMPEYMQIYFRPFLDIYREIEEQMVAQRKLYRVHYAKEAMKRLVRAYFQEAKWFHEKYTPTLDEYMPVALISSGYEMMAVTSIIGLGDIATEDSFNWLLNQPKIVTASEAIARLMDDIASHKFEQKRGHVASSIECYMIQYGGTEEEAVEELRKLITRAWMDINEECLRPTAVPMPLLTCILNLARVIEVLYKTEDGYTHVGKRIKESVTSLLIDPVPEKCILAGSGCEWGK
ncbi:hypothetical protein SLE2022_017590 [Rubroshorea leprosula]